MLNKPFARWILPALAACLTLPIQAEDVYFSSVNPADGNGKPGSITCYENNGLAIETPGRCGLTAAPTFASAWVIIISNNRYTAAAVSLGRDGQPWVNDANDGQSPSLAATDRVLFQDPYGSGEAYFSGAIVRQESGSTQTVTIDACNDPLCDTAPIATVTQAIPSDVATFVPMAPVQFIGLKIHFPTRIVFGANHFQVSAVKPAGLSLAGPGSATSQGASASFTATLTSTVVPATAPTGTVDFLDNGHPIAGCQGVAVASSQAQCSTTALGIGTHTILARYNGDSLHASNFAQADHTVTGAANTPPVAANDSYTLAQDGTLTEAAATGLLANDTDAEGDTLTVAVKPAARNGTLTIQNNGSFTYTPKPGFYGTETLVYVASDGKANSNNATLTLTVTHVNHPPLAHDDSYTTPHNAPLTVAGPGLLANDSDPDGNPTMRVVVNTPPTKGTLALGTDGGFTYTPGGGVCAADSTDTFTYYANDGTVNSNLATVTIGLHCVNRAPVAGPDSYKVAQGARLSVAAPGLLANDSDPDGNPLTAMRVTQPTLGALAFNTNGSFDYRAVTAGTDSFTYKVSDGALESVPVTVTITVTASNQPPLAAGDSYRTTKNAPLNVPAPGVLGNDIDPDGNPLRLSSVLAQPTHGNLTMQTDGSFTYRPQTNYVGLDSFTYAVTDGTAVSPAATVVIDVASANAAPVARNDSYTTPITTRLTVPAPGLLGNDSDADGNQPLAVVIASQPTQGTLALAAGGGFTYTPNGGTCTADSTDTFTYTANDGKDNSNLATVTITRQCDSDSDSVDAAVEAGAPNSGDGNGDGTPDAQQAAVSSAVGPGGRYVTMAVSGGCNQIAYFSAYADPGTDTGHTYPQGMVDFLLPCAQATVTLYYHGVTSLAGYRYRKYGPTTPGDFSTLAWYTLPGATFGSTTIGGQTVATVTFTLTDGQLGDDTGVDTLIFDAGGPSASSTPGTTQPIPTLSEWGMIILSLVLAGLTALRLRRQ